MSSCHRAALRPRPWPGPGALALAAAEARAAAWRRTAAAASAVPSPERPCASSQRSRRLSCTSLVVAAGRHLV
eukprot:6862862-Heterocapsa_arctica.AAC.1